MTAPWQQLICRPAAGPHAIYGGGTVGLSAGAPVSRRDEGPCSSCSCTMTARPWPRPVVHPPVSPPGSCSSTPHYSLPSMQASWPVSARVHGAPSLLQGRRCRGRMQCSGCAGSEAAWHGIAAPSMRLSWLHVQALASAAPAWTSPRARRGMPQPEGPLGLKLTLSRPEVEGRPLKLNRIRCPTSWPGQFPRGSCRCMLPHSMPTSS